MNCHCSGRNQVQDHQQKVDELFNAVGLKEVIDQGRAAIEEAGRSLDLLNRSERAAALGFGPEISDIHLSAAKRSNERVREQAQTVLARIDDLAKQDVWRSHVSRVKKEFKQREGVQKLKNAREDIRLALLNDDSGMSANVAKLSLTTLDRAIEAAAKGDLDRILVHLRAVMTAALKGFESSDMGRQAVGLGLLGSDDSSDTPEIRGGADTGWCVALAACLAWAYSSLIASMVICFATPFCWCCFHLAVLGTFAVHQLACLLALEPACRGG
jgi:hypothetical protein